MKSLEHHLVQGRVTQVRDHRSIRSSKTDLWIDSRDGVEVLELWGQPCDVQPGASIVAYVPKNFALNGAAGVQLQSLRVREIPDKLDIFDDNGAYVGEYRNGIHA